MAGKVNKFAEKAKKLKRSMKVPFNTDGGEVIEFEIQSLGQDVFDKVNEKYDNMKPPVPTKRLPAKNGKVKIVDDTEDPAYKRAIRDITRKNMAELALQFLAEHERPEGEIDEQIQAIQEVELAGFIGKIVNNGLEISDLIDKPLEDEIEEEKND